MPIAQKITLPLLDYEYICYPAASRAQRGRGAHARHARGGGRAARDHARPGRARGGLAGHRVSRPQGPRRAHHLWRGAELGEARLGAGPVRAPGRRPGAGRRGVHLRGQGSAARPGAGAVAPGPGARDHAAARPALREGGARPRGAGLRPGRAGRLPGRGHARRDASVATDDLAGRLWALERRADLTELRRHGLPVLEWCPPEPLEAALVSVPRRRVRLASAG